LIRCIEENGNIYEGNFTTDGYMNGFCIGFSGRYNEIEMGWFKNDMETGNQIKLNAHDMSIKCSGWYEDGKRVGFMKHHEKYKRFSISNIFSDYPFTSQESILS